MSAAADDESELRALVALGSRVLAANGHDDFIWGHLAVRDPAGRGVWMKKSGIGLEEVTRDDVLLVGFDGELLAGEGAVHIEWPIHTEAMLAREDIAATVHSHAPHCNAISASGSPVKPVSHPGTLFVPPEVPRFTKTANLIVSRELGADVAAELGAQHAMFLVNHGIVVAGNDIADAVVRSVLFEKACHHQLLASAAGPIEFFTSGHAGLDKRETTWPRSARQSLWNYLIRTLD